jgi:hypothetical protein
MLLNCDLAEDEAMTNALYSLMYMIRHWIRDNLPWFVYPYLGGVAAFLIVYGIVHRNLNALVFAIGPLLFMIGLYQSRRSDGRSGPRSYKRERDRGES